MPDETNMHSSRKVVLDLDGADIQPDAAKGPTVPKGGNASRKVELDLGPVPAAPKEQKVAEDAPRLDEKPAEKGTETEAAGEGPAAEEPAIAETPASPKRRAGKKAALAACAACGIGAAALVIGVTMGTLAAQTQVRANDLPAAEQAQSAGSEGSALQDQNATTLPAQGGSAVASGDAAAAGEAAQPISETCEHDWQPEATERDVEATFEEVDVPATYEEATEYHTLCNVCYEQVDGKVAEHRASTGHAGVTKNVPVKVTKVKTEAHKETRQATPAHKERVWTKEKCGKCGAERDVDEHVETVE